MIIYYHFPKNGFGRCYMRNLFRRLSDRPIVVFLSSRTAYATEES